MREIKFRGKRTHNGEWVYGCFTRYSEDISYITANLVEGESYEVSTASVGQFIGLLDVNGKEIYEGDIIKTDDSNWGYGGDYDKENDGYLYTTVPSIDKLIFVGEGTDNLFDMYGWHQGCEVFGNMHEQSYLG